MAKVVSKTKTRKKRWHNVAAPKLFNDAIIGETYVGDPEEMVGRRMSVNMMNVTGDPKRQNITVFFQIKEFKEGKGQTFCRGFQMTPSSIKRFVRRGRDRIDDSFTVKTKDGHKIRIKPLVITTNNTTKPVQSKMRMTARKLLTENISKTTFSTLLNSILRFELQKKMKSELAKIYPVRNFEVRMIKLLDEEAVPEDFKPEPRKEEPKVEKVEEKVEKKSSEDKKPVEKVEKKEDSEEKPKTDPAKKTPAKKEEEKPKVAKKPAAKKAPAKKPAAKKTAAKKPAAKTSKK